MTTLPWPQDDVHPWHCHRRPLAVSAPCLAGWLAPAPLVAGGSLPSPPAAPPPGPLPPWRPRQWGSVSRSPGGSWMFFYRGDSSLEDSEAEGWHLGLFSFLFGPIY